MAILDYDVFEDQYPKLDLDNFFMRLDRNISAESYEDAQKKVLGWADNEFINPIDNDFSVEEKVICSPGELSNIVKKMRGSL